MYIKFDKIVKNPEICIYNSGIASRNTERMPDCTEYQLLHNDALICFSTDFNPTRNLTEDRTATYKLHAQILS